MIIFLWNKRSTRQKKKTESKVGVFRGNRKLPYAYETSSPQCKLLYFCMLMVLLNICWWSWLQYHDIAERGRMTKITLSTFSFNPNRKLSSINLLIISYLNQYKLEEQKQGTLSLLMRVISNKKKRERTKRFHPYHITNLREVNARLVE